MIARKRIVIVSTGGTIEKTFDELQGTLINRRSVLDVMLQRLTLGGVEVSRVPLMNKDSLEMTSTDHDSIADCVHAHAAGHDGVVVVHGTDRLAQSGERLVARHSNIGVPVVFTGAMRPFEMQNSDALQNLTEALVAVQLVSPGVYVCFHNRVLRFPGVVKDYDRRTFCYSHELTPA